MPKPKTRVVVNYENADRLLFSIRENGDKSLTVVRKTPMNHEDPTEGNIVIAHDKFSIHVSPESPGTTITRKVLLANGRTISSAQFINDSKSSLFCLMYSALSPELGGTRYVAKPRPRDATVRVGAFHRHDMATLIYHIVVCDLEQTIPSTPGHSIATIPFTRWKVGVLSCFLNLPATPFGREATPTTRPPKVDGVDDPQYAGLLESHGRDSMPADELKDVLLETNYRMSALLVKKLCDAIPEDKDRCHKLMNHRLYFHPDVRSLFAERLGAAPGQRAFIPGL